MRVVLLCSQPHDLTQRWVERGLRALGHEVETTHRPDLPLADAAPVGYRLADGWSEAPDTVLALGTAAGLAGMVATRERPAGLLLRLDRPGRSGDVETTRVEGALARGVDAVLAGSPTDVETLVRLGVPRRLLHLLPEAVDAAAVRPALVEDDPQPVVALDETPESVHALLRGMAAGRPAVVVDEGALPDLVADEVCGLVVGRDGLRAAVQSLVADPVRRASMGMAAGDRVSACYDLPVVVETLGRLLDETAGRQSRAA
jgi:glycosyltransferase involved in cell wall biosynthesis